MRIITVTYVINGTDYDTVDVDIVLTDFGLVPESEAFGIQISDIQDEVQ